MFFSYENIGFYGFIFFFQPVIVILSMTLWRNKLEINLTRKRTLHSLRNEVPPCPLHRKRGSAALSKHHLHQWSCLEAKVLLRVLGTF